MPSSLQGCGPFLPVTYARQRDTACGGEPVDMPKGCRGDRGEAEVGRSCLTCSARHVSHPVHQAALSAVLGSVALLPHRFIDGGPGNELVITQHPASRPDPCVLDFGSPVLVSLLPQSLIAEFKKITKTFYSISEV